jgi:[calcium/calmodulin-dependent protein kinase] kinase
MRSQYTISTCSCISKKRGGKKQINQYIILGLIGKGNFAKVKKIFNKDTKETLAMKVINKQQLRKRAVGPGTTRFTAVEKEVAIMKKISHPFILKLIEIIDDPDHHKQYLIQEFVAKGDL